MRQVLSPVLDFFKGKLHALLENFKQAGFSREAAHDRAQNLLVDAMAFEPKVQQGQLARAHAPDSREGLPESPPHM